MGNNHYYLQGEVMALVFQHGLGANHAQIATLLKPLKNVRLLTSDVPGHGQCPLDSTMEPSFNAYTDEIIRIMDLAGIYKAVIGGLSMGSGIAVNMACRYPKRVAGLILHRPAWELSPRPQNLAILLKVAQYVDNMDEGKSSFMQLPEFQSIQASLPKAAGSLLGMFERDQQAHTARVLTKMVEDKPCPTNTTPMITFPALVIGNDDDPLHPWEMAEAWHKILPNSHLKKVTSRYRNDQAHQDQVVAAIQQFMNTIRIN